METTIQRKEFPSVPDAIMAQRAENYIDGQPKGAGTWPDGEVVISPALMSGKLMIRDKMGTDRGGPMRYIELWRGRRLIVTFVYSHFHKRLVRTF